ncbi:FecCD family ABC transporter permease [Vibrio palustris]|uniref:Putative siderophore transport system permease protein YfhA n=1 Tax=Vibrio palustris TaxID=1918946 RepID=A0A1R4B4N6_9VIBR|nr:iron ABC transporter permease [Vibrio palustris]SJL83884.1 putative siderophore transport system permease protein YfhA [Vibrio palustris]
MNKPPIKRTFLHKQWNIRTRWCSFCLTPRLVGVLMLAVLVTLVVMGLSLSFGTQHIGIRQVASSLAYPDDRDSFVVQTLRLPRMLLAAMVGAALGGSGLVLQSMIRNPLASPDIIGITSGASAAAVGFLAFFQSLLGLAWLPVFAIAGALLASLLIYLLAWRNGVTPMRLVLVGIGVSAVMGAVVTLLIATSSESTSLTAYIWLTGSVYGANWRDVQSLLPWVVVSFALSVFFSRRINALELGDHTAVGLGVPLQWTRVSMLILSVVMAAPAIAYAGAISFVGLIAPHIARRFVDRNFTVLLPLTAAIGACLVMLADIGGRLLFQPLDIPAGVFVSAIGAPFFIYLLYRQRF